MSDWFIYISIAILLTIFFYYFIALLLYSKNSTKSRRIKNSLFLTLLVAAAVTVIIVLTRNADDYTFSLAVLGGIVSSAMVIGIQSYLKEHDIFDNGITDPTIAKTETEDKTETNNDKACNVANQIEVSNILKNTGGKASVSIELPDGTKIKIQ